MDYNTLIASKDTPGSIAAWINHSAVSAAAPTIIDEAQSWIYRRMRNWRMKFSLNTSTMTLSSGALALPGDYLEDIDFIITGTAAKGLTRKPDKDVRARYAYDGNGNRIPGPPNVFYNDQSNFYFDTVVDQSYPYDLLYFQQPLALSTLTSGTNSNMGLSTNFLTQFYPRLMRCACMASASEFMKDMGQGNYDRTYWDQLAQGEIDIANQESDRSVHTQEAGMIIL